ncbi:hypothetical protein MGN70_004675 [Eutypa lata]|nr:hypothetical protein MGN70_004675 [Eutypa lata]
MQFSKIFLVVAGFAATAFAGCHDQSNSIDCNGNGETINCGAHSDDPSVRTCCTTWAECPTV